MAGNDVSIMAGILSMLIVMSILIPWIQDAADVTKSEVTVPMPVGFQSGNVNQTSIDEYESISSGSWYGGGKLGILTSLLTSFFWYYPWFPVWLTTLHIALRIIGGVIIYRLIRSGAG